MATTKQSIRRNRTRPVKRSPVTGAEDIEWVEEPPPKTSATQGNWLRTLTPLLNRKNSWARVKQFDRPEQAIAAQRNLTARRIRIPEPDNDWTFAARGCELYAIYRGPFRGKRSK